jgi:hypothetical protein
MSLFLRRAFSDVVWPKVELPGPVTGPIDWLCPKAELPGELPELPGGLAIADPARMRLEAAAMHILCVTVIFIILIP